MIVKNCLKCNKVLEVYEDCCDCGGVLFSKKYEMEEIKKQDKKDNVEKKTKQKKDDVEEIEENYNE